MFAGLFASRRTKSLAVRRQQRRPATGFEALEPRLALAADVTTIKFTDLSNLPTPNKIYVGGWINAGHHVQSRIVQVADVVYQSGSSGSQPQPTSPLNAANPTITRSTATYNFDKSNPANLTIQGTGFGSVPSANTIVFYEDAAGTKPSPVNPKGAGGPFYFSIPDGSDTLLKIAFDASPNPQPNPGKLYAQISTTWAYPLQANGTFATEASPAVPLYDVASLPASGVSLNKVTNGNDRLFFVAAPSQPTSTSSNTPWGNYPISALPTNTSTVPPGPFGFLEFGYGAQFNTSYVDSFGLNWSFVDDAKPDVVYGVKPTVTRQQMQKAYSNLTANDPLGAPFTQLLWMSTTTVPAVVEGQFTAIVSPKDWLTQPTPPVNLQNYWIDTVNAFFTPGNHLSISLNKTVYSGTADAKGDYTLTGGIVIPKKLYAGTNVFSQLQTDNTFPGGQLKDAVFEAFSRGVALDGVWKAGRSGIMPASYSSDAWTSYLNWYKPGATAYDPSIHRTYDVYAKFFHYATSEGKDFRDVTGAKPMLGLNPANSFAMAYGFSLDESPSINTANGGTWPADAIVNGGTTPAADATITVTFGPWVPSSLSVVSIDTKPPQTSPSVPTRTTPGVVTWDVTFNKPVTGVTAANFALVASAGLTGSGNINVSPASASSSMTWTVTANTGTGTGTLGLNLTNPGSIQDASGKKLTTTFTGQVYAVSETPPVAPTATVTIPQNAQNPTSAATVTFDVTFSLPVIGLSAANFMPITTGGVIGATVGPVTGSGTTYTITVSTGSGSGTLALRLVAPGTGITPAPGGLPVTSAAYTIRQTPVAPALQSISRDLPNPTNQTQVSWTVTFSEPVTGVNGNNFNLVSYGLRGGKILQVVPAPGTGTAWTVTALTGSGTGTLRLDMVNAAAITDAEGLTPTGIPLQGQVYDVVRGNAPGVSIPIAFWAPQGRRANLVWPRGLPPFSGPANRELNVTLAVTGGAGGLAASRGIRGVTVAGTGTGSEISLSGTAQNLNAYFRTAGRIGYTPSGESLLPRVLSVSATQTTSGGLTGFDRTAILIRGRSPAGVPVINPRATGFSTLAGTPLVITYAQLVTATGATTANSRSVVFLLGGVSSGRLELWDGAKWIRVPATQPKFKEPILAPGGQIRWTPPARATGQLAAFRVLAWDGWWMSGVSQVRVNLTR